MLIIARISVRWVLARMLLSRSPIAINGPIYVFCDSSFAFKTKDLVLSKTDSVRIV